MPDTNLVTWAIQQGGWAVVCVLMFLYIQRSHWEHAEQLARLTQRAHEQVEMFLRFGEERGKLEARIAASLDHIDRHLGHVQICPVSLLNVEDLRVLAEGENLTRAELLDRVRDVIRQQGGGKKRG